MRRPEEQQSLDALFPSDAIVVYQTISNSLNRLLPQEATLTANASPKRIQEFATGRACARQALHLFGIDNFPILRSPCGYPIWPTHLVGSITHTTSFAAAVVAPKSTSASVGIDAEHVVDIDADLWPTICTPQEMDRLRSLPIHLRSRAAALIFSAKEAFYKCHFPCFHEWIDFHDVDLTWSEMNSSSGHIYLQSKNK